MPSRGFYATLGAKLELWARSRLELERELAASASERREQILLEMEKLGSKSRAAILKLHEMKVRERQLPARPTGMKPEAGQAAPGA
jgi:hypothetical protein